MKILSKKPDPTSKTELTEENSSVSSTAPGGVGQEKNNERSSIIHMKDKKDRRSDFAKEYEDDILFNLQIRMRKKFNTKRFNSEDFVNKAKNDYSEQKLEVEEVDSLPETPEPEIDEPDFFF